MEENLRSLDLALDAATIAKIGALVGEDMRVPVQPDDASHVLDREAKHGDKHGDKHKGHHHKGDDENDKAER